jgi:hypothetical protein
MRDIEVNKNPVSSTGRADFADTGSRWRILLWWAAAELNLCTYLKRTAGRRVLGHIIIGTPERVKVTEMTAEYLIGAVRRISRKAEKAAGDDAGKFFRKEFRLGCASRILQRAQKIIAERSAASWTASTGETLPAILDMVTQARAAAQAFCDAQMNVQKPKDKPKPLTLRNMSAYMMGHMAGDELSLDRQIEQNTVKGLLS